MSGSGKSPPAGHRRLLAMGDIHGQFDKMQNVLSQADYDPFQDKLVLLGDYVDRGPQSGRVLQEVIRLVAGGAVALYGNHEDMMLRALRNRHKGRLSSVHLEQWFANGGEATLGGYRDDGELLDAHLRFMETLPRWHRESDILFVHAGIRPGLSLEQQAENDLIWIREPYILGYRGPQDIVSGHTPTQYLGRYELFPDLADTSKPVIREHKIFLDTGAAWGGPLTIMEFPSRTFWQG